MPLLFRVEAGPGVGLGHLQRCLALAEAVQRRGVASTFLTMSSDDVRQRIESAGAEMVALQLASSEYGGAADLAAVLRVAGERRAETVVVDSYAVHAEYLSGLRAAGLRVVYIDDLAREALPAHVVINAGAQAKALPYASSTGDTQFLLGPEYALLKAGPWPPSKSIGPVRQLLLTVGGDDPLGVMATLIDLVSAVPGDFIVVAAVGPFAATSDAVSAAVARSPRAVRVVQGALGLRPLMADVDVAVSAGGQTLYELAAAGVPTIAIELFENQRGSLGALADAGVVKNAGRVADAAFGGRFRALLSGVLDEPGERERLRDAGQRLVDGRGADRAAAAVLAIA